MKILGKLGWAWSSKNSILLIFIALVVINSGCQLRSSQAERQQRAIEKRKEERRRQELAKYEEKRRRHEQMQSTEGKKLLKNAEKHTQRLDKASAPQTFFLWRWLGLNRGGKLPCNP